ncbi:MAG: Rpn family recombination-promoting nuclease/putative transposase [Candidatus Kuenenia sp.]|nr:Rpn family recombination-promoting nuclease/putative transposase [Candidatus Kuenenia hertensis]
MLKRLDISTLALENNSYIDEELKEHFSDIVYTCLCNDKELKITLLFEHKSHPEKCPHLQLLRYLLKIWETNMKQVEGLVQVIPVILYHGKETWKIRRFSDCFEGTDEVFYRFIPEFEYLLTDLSDYSNEEIKDKVFRRASLQIAMLLMRNIFDEKHLEDKLKEFFEIGKRYFQEEEGLRFLESVIRYLYNAPEIPVERVIETVKEISEEGGILSMTIAARLIEKGKIEGKIEGEKSLLIRLIERKWGRLQPSIKERLNKINTLEELEALGERVITSDCIEELFRNE